MFPCMQRKRLPRGIEDDLEQEIASLKNCTNFNIDRVSDKQLFVTFHLFETRQSSFQAENRYGGQFDDGGLKAINSSVAISIPSDADEDEFVERLKNTVPKPPDRCRAQNGLDGGRMCMAEWNNCDLDTYIECVKALNTEFSR